MTIRVPFKRLLLRAVLRNVSPMVIRVVAMPDYLDLPDFDDVCRAILGWDGLGYIFRVHGQEFNSFRRRTQSKTLRDFQFRPQEKFLYTCGAIDLWEWEFRLLDQDAGAAGDDTPICLGGRGAAAPGALRRPHGLSSDAEVAARGQPSINVHCSSPNSFSSRWATLQTCSRSVDACSGASIGKTSSKSSVVKP